MEGEMTSLSSTQEPEKKAVPYDLQIEVLSRIPALHLWPLRCLSKQLFRAITLDPKFTNLHLKRSLSRSSPDILVIPSRLAKDFVYMINDERVVPLELSFYETVYAWNAITQEFEGICRGNYFHGICDGMLLFSSKKQSDVYVCNPIRRDHITISYSHTTRFGVDASRSSFGFGFDHASRKYKVVRAAQIPDVLTDDLIPRTEVSVYDLGPTSSWRVVDQLQRTLVTSPSGIVPLVEGTLHWLSTSEPGSFVQDLIIAFSLQHEDFRKLSPPNGIGVLVDLREMGGKLCMVSPGSAIVDIWTMNTYGEDSSWAKQFCIRTPQGCAPFTFLDTIGITHSGEVILKEDMKGSHRVIYYDSETGSVRSAKHFKLPYNFTAYTYTGTIISPRKLLKGD